MEVPLGVKSEGWVADKKVKEGEKSTFGKVGVSMQHGNIQE